MIQRALVIAAAAAALNLHAATKYRIDFEATTAHESTRPASVAVDGDRIRIDYAPVDEPVRMNAMYSTDGGKSYIALNSGMGTWFRAKSPIRPFTPQSARIGGEDKARKIKWSWREEPGAEAGAHIYVGTLDYAALERMAGITVPSHCTAQVEIRTSEAVEGRWLGDLPFRVGVPEVDAQLAASGAAIKGFPLRISLSSARQYDRGPLLKDQRTMTVRDITTVPSVDPKLFETPKGYRFEEPIVGAPGVITRQ